MKVQILVTQNWFSVWIKNQVLLFSRQKQKIEHKSSRLPIISPKIKLHYLSFKIIVF